ncbi:hypothetical protein [Kitasatospora sp. NPDC057936]
MEPGAAGRRLAPQAAAGTAGREKTNRPPQARTPKRRRALGEIDPW